MKVVFRVDASLQIGTGHVMRCLTLARALRERGDECYFVCREHKGNLIAFIEAQGFAVFVLKTLSDIDCCEPIGRLPHSQWLGTTEVQDFLDSKELLESVSPDWVVVDHYAISFSWEEMVKSQLGCKVFVIDDLADRNHSADVLLDQNIVHNASDYADLVDENCCLLIGLQYTLLRPEFRLWRKISLEHKKRVVERSKILINMGGVDQFNFTSKVLEALVRVNYLDLDVSVVMGSTAPHLDEVRKLAAILPFQCRVLVGVNNMAELMSEADFAIGAAGSTTWERCCLGVPSIQVIIASNQEEVALCLQKEGVALLVQNDEFFIENLVSYIKQIREDSVLYQSMVLRSSSLLDGNGVDRVLDFLK